jgi:Cu2+-exporting ATPase
MVRTGTALPSRTDATQVEAGTGAGPKEPEIGPHSAAGPAAGGGSAATVASGCAHCGLPLPAGAPYGAFCCAGCRAVRAILEAEGLDRFYTLGGGEGQPVGRVPKVDPATHDWLPELEAGGRLGEQLARVRCDIQGIHCAACVWLLQEVWRRTPGAVRVDLNPALGQAELVYDPRQHTLARYVDEVERLGYRMGPVGKAEARPDRGLLIRLGTCSALAMNAMMFAFSEHFGMSAEDEDSYALFRTLSFVLATAAVLIGGPEFFRGALAGLRRRVLHLDLPISIGIALAYGTSAFGFLTGLGAAYFDTVTIFVTLMLLGRYLQRRAVQRNRDYLLANDGAEHVRVKRVRGDASGVGALDRIPVRDVRPGDELLLAPGDLLPVDAVVADAGGAQLSLDWISGESRPRPFAAGEPVPAGAFLGGSRPVRVRVTRDADASGLLRLLATPAQADDELRGRERFWVLVNRIYVGLVLGLAALAGLGWAFVDPIKAVGVTTAVLVVTCPCALGIATPLAFDLAVAGLRRFGIFVRNPNLLEKARHVRKLIFDKTGTLTWGGVRVRPLREPEPEPERPDAGLQVPVRDLLFTMASSSNHPVSAAVAAWLAEQPGPGPRFVTGLAVEEVVGAGLRARHEGAELRFGKGSFALGDPDAPADGSVCLTRDGRVLAVFAVEEDYRSGAADEIRALAAAGYELHLVSGDRPDRVRRAAADLGFDPDLAQGGVDPERKAALIAALDAGDTLMVGDGLNDAPAFEAAFCAGTPALDRPVMPARADFFYTGLGTGAVSRVLSTAARFHRVVRVNLGLAAVYNLVAVGLAMAGLMTPLLCAILMPLSSLVLIGYTMLALRLDLAHLIRPGGPR